MKLKDITGQKFGRLTALKVVGKSKSRHSVWECLCECGNTCLVNSHDFKRGGTSSCGCLKKELNLKHGLNNHPVFRIWCSIKQRCNNKNCKAYFRYGGRGISISDEFLDVATFFEYVTSLPKYNERVSKKLSLDRINNNGNYERGNLRWATQKEQMNNTSVNRKK